MTPITLLSSREDESPAAFGKRVSETEGELLVILLAKDVASLHADGDLADFSSALSKIRTRVRVAVKDERVAAALRARSIRVLTRPTDLKRALAEDPLLTEALRMFSPQVWRQELRSRLQAMGLLSLPKIRIWFLIFLSAVLFFFVVFRLLPSAEVKIWPRQDPVNQTVNIFLVQSGARVDIPQRVRTMPLVPIVIRTRRSMTFDQISKEFIGTSAEVSMTIVNAAKESYSLRGGTRLLNQAGMIFRIQEPVNIAPGEEIAVRAKADDLDLYGEITGKRGNVPAGLRWDFAGLAPEEQQVVYAENRTEARGGTTAYRTVLQKSDLELARKTLEQDVLATAKQLADEELILGNTQRGEGSKLEMLYYEELTKTTFSGFILPTEFIGEPVASVPIEGGVEYRSYAYDAQAILTMLSEEMETHVGTEKRLLPESLRMERMIVHVIDYADDLAWIKLTVDLTGTEEFILDPLSPPGARFGSKVRNAVSGKSTEEGVRIVKNFPEVERVEIDLWPPWNTRLPTISAHIAVLSQRSE